MNRFPERDFILQHNHLSFNVVFKIFPMHKLLIPALICLLSLVCFTACDKSDDNTPDNAPVWVITFYESPKDQDAGAGAGLFTGYAFEPNITDKTLLVHLPGGATESGDWTLENNNSRLTILLPKASDPLDGLNGTWIVGEYTDTSIKLEQAPAGVPSPSVDGRKLHFVKQ